MGRVDLRREGARGPCPQRQKMIPFLVTIYVRHQQNWTIFSNFMHKKTFGSQAPPGLASAGEAYCSLINTILRIIKTSKGKEEDRWKDSANEWDMEREGSKVVTDK